MLSCLYALLANDGKGAFEAHLRRICDALERLCDAFIILGWGIVADSGKM